MFQVALPCYLALKSGRPVSINVNKTRKHFSRNIHGARMFPPFPIWETLFPVSALLFSGCKLCLRYTAGDFNETPSMRALAKILRAQASEHSYNFCEQFEQRPNFASTFKLDGTIRYPYIYNNPVDKSKLSSTAIETPLGGRGKEGRGGEGDLNIPNPFNVWPKYPLCCSSVSDFKNKIKTFLFKIAFVILVKRFWT